MSSAVGGLELAATLFLFVPWLVAVLLAARLRTVRSPLALRLTARGVLTAVVISLLATLVRAGSAVALGTVEPLLAGASLIVAVPLVAVPAAVTLLWSLPRLWRLRRKTPGTELEPGTRLAAADPRLLVPVRAALTGAAAGSVLLVMPPVPSYLGDVLALGAGMLALTGLLWAVQRRRADVLARTGRVPGLRVRALRGLGTTVVAAALLFSVVTVAARTSAVPAAYDMSGGHAGHGTAPVSLATLTGPRSRTPDRRFALEARTATIRLASGKLVQAWTFNDRAPSAGRGSPSGARGARRAPGPELRVRQGELVEVRLTNRDVAAGVTLHWHGIDVPNAEDGVAGLTQDAVRPGGSHVYRFVAERAGTFWYHSHQRSSEQVRRGLFGPIIIEPAASEGTDIAVMLHEWRDQAGAVTAFGTDDGRRTRVAEPGSRVRARLIEADDFPRRFTLTGTTFKVVAIDGTDLHDPGELVSGTRVQVAAGGRADLVFTMPDRPVLLTLEGGDGPGIVFSPRPGAAVVEAAEGGPVLDPAAYGTPAPTPFTAGSRFDRDFTLYLDVRIGVHDGRPAGLWTVNGKAGAHAAMLLVREGDLVRTIFVNRSPMDHPMHLHGHKMLVLERNGRATTGSPWWVDTLNVAPGETYVVAFRADNPGIWMDHCHNLVHAANGMQLHLGYEGVATPYRAGPATGNLPE
jgi:FtsP/CotA-like multicopper oxidase with cupredoxin domain